MKTILLIDDHPAIYKYIPLLLREEFPDVSCLYCERENEAFAILTQNPVDFIILDLELKEESGFSLIEKLRKSYPAIPILVFTQHDEPECIQRAFKMGVRGYISKREDPQLTLDAIRMIEKGEPYLGKIASSHLIGGLTQTTEKWEENLLRLSRQEKTIFDLLGMGLTRPEIAERLHISSSTVNTHIERTRKKLNIESGKKLEFLAHQYRNNEEKSPFFRKINTRI